MDLREASGAFDAGEEGGDEDGVEGEVASLPSCGPREEVVSMV